METPDGKVFEKPEEGGKRRNAGSAWFGVVVRRFFDIVIVLATLAGRAVMTLARGLGKGIITTWRLASALDSALWRAIKLIAGRFGDAFMHAVWLTGQVIRSLILWLPTRTGRAYSAISGVALIISGLWIADELRAGSRAVTETADNRRAPVDAEDPILARIQGRYVHLSEIENAARVSGLLDADQALTPQTAFQRGLVETYVEQRLLARAAQSEGLHRTPQVLRTVNAARDRILAASLIRQRLNDEVGPETVERFYNSQREITVLGDEVRARHIVVETGTQAEEIIASLNAGGDFATLAREHSLDRSTSPLGGNIGWFSQAMMEKPLADVAFSTPVGELAPPFQSEFGWHVLEVLGRRPTNAKPFAEVRDDIEEYLRLRLINETLSTLQEDSQVVYYRPDVPNDPATVVPIILPGDENSNVDAEESE